MLNKFSPGNEGRGVQGGRERTSWLNFPLVMRGEGYRGKGEDKLVKYEIGMNIKSTQENTKVNKI